MPGDDVQVLLDLVHCPGLNRANLDSRERVTKAIELMGPDVIPNGCYSLPGATTKYGADLERLFKRFPSDLHQFVASFSNSWLPYELGTNRDIWRCVWKNLTPGIMGQIVEHPLSDWNNLENYRVPDPSDIVDFREVARSIATEGHGKYVLADSQNFFERLHWLRGFKQTLIDITSGSKEFQRLTRMIFDFKMQFVRRWLELDVDGVYFLDDWGTMQGLMISPKLWRERFRPLYQDMFNAVRRSGKHVLFHSDGCALDVVPDFIEMGVDALNL